ncbi:hypothetical protein VP96_02992 [Vibrio cholerae]|nr:hypothetical protein VP96_02992 [Vibrio cholerae]KKP20197.1 hypothetical protein VS86_01573 [Vibrio cholerae]
MQLANRLFFKEHTHVVQDSENIHLDISKAKKGALCALHSE